MERFIIAHMYPDLLDLYGDRGNLICLKKRLHDYGFNCEIRSIRLHEKIDFNTIDMIFMGGGSDREQGLVYHDLLTKAERFKEEIENGLPVLCVCGAYQLLGKYYQAYDGSIMEGLGIFGFSTQGKKERLIGNILIESETHGKKNSVVGFENHGGRIWLEDHQLKPFGKVIKGFGNNGQDGSEGLWYKNLIGTYLHGPLLPKNPHIADYFIEAMTARKGLTLNKKLNDEIEWFAHEQVIKKLQKSR